MTGTSRGQAPSWKTEQSSWPLLKLMRETSKRFTTTAILWKKKFELIMIATLTRTTSKRYNTHILWRKKAFICYCTFLRQDKYRENCRFIRTSIIHSPLHKSNEINPVLSQTGALCVKSEISYCGNCHIAKHIYQHWKATSRYSWRLGVYKFEEKIQLEGKGGFLTSLSLPYSWQGQPWNLESAKRRSASQLNGDRGRPVISELQILRCRLAWQPPSHT